MVLEISVLKKQRENEIIALRDECAMTYGGDCNNRSICGICLLRDDARELTRLYESKETKRNFGKSSRK